MSDYSLLEERFGERLLREEPLARHTAARLGGPAEALIVAHTLPDLIFAAQFAWGEGVPYRVLGGGANVLVADVGFRGLVIVNRATGVTFGAAGEVRAESGANLSTLARRCLKRGWQGLEWAVSVPGTVGGAAINNAGAHGSDMAASVREVVVHRSAGVARLAPDDLAYGYRTSLLKGSAAPFLVTVVTLALTPGGDPAQLNAQAAEYVAHRKRTQPSGASLGSIFKNPPGDYAGRLIEAAGLKGARRGSVQISPVHANFIVNTGTAWGDDSTPSSRDYYALIRLAQTEVEAQFGVRLEPEIEFLGNFT
ncbi:MAG: UDP-N-acetylmuramate dehydrogenase [Anaerolineae bacterium]|nr:UDP-N-acetylmuramate dehydrogenase [Anaerolineae bacterium]